MQLHNPFSDPGPSPVGRARARAVGWWAAGVIFALVGVGYHLPQFFVFAAVDWAGAAATTRARVRTRG
ncbi:hypothetical protein BH20ACT6_BH20ACT6_11350 [soil metagenome]